jgi:hypothetical protein
VNAAYSKQKGLSGKAKHAKQNQYLITYHNHHIDQLKKKNNVK